VSVTVVELGPRDGLQNEAMPVSVADRVAFVQALAAAGLQRIEAGAFVHPGRVPQMASSDEVCATVAADPMLTDRHVRISALVPNLTGLKRARAAGLREVAVFPAASATFSQRNLNQSVDEALRSAGDVCASALASGLRVRGYVSTAFGCPYEGDVPVAQVIRVCEALLAHGVFEVAISDTIGVAHPALVGQCRIFVVVGKFEEALTTCRQLLAKRDGRDAFAQAQIAAALGRLGRLVDSSKQLQQLRTQYDSAVRAEQPNLAFFLATAHAGLEQTDQVFPWLEVAARGKSSRLAYLRVDPRFAVVRGDPRWSQVVAAYEQEP